MVGGGVDLADSQVAEFGFECVASSFAAGKAGGEDHAVVGEGGCRDAMAVSGFGEFCQDDGGGDAAVCGHGDGVAGVVVDPAEDFDVGAAGEAPVGEVGLPAFVGLFGGESDVGAFGPFVGCGCDEAGGVEVAADGGDRNVEVVVVLEVPGDGVGSGVEAFAVQFGAQGDHEVDGGLG